MGGTDKAENERAGYGMSLKSGKHEDNPGRVIVGLAQTCAGRPSEGTALRQGVCRKTTLRGPGELCGSAVINLSQEFHRRDAEHAELTLRKTIIPTDSLTEVNNNHRLGKAICSSRGHRYIALANSIFLRSTAAVRAGTISAKSPTMP